MTSREKKWIVYDVGNSAFVLLSTAVVPIYTNSLLKAAGETNIVSTWGYAQTIAFHPDLRVREDLLPDVARHLRLDAR